MDATTYGESVISIPSLEMGPPTGPIEKGMTYIVRPRIAPSNRPPSTCRIEAGSRQLFVGPASCASSAPMKVRLSMRATSSGVERAR